MNSPTAPVSQEHEARLVSRRQAVAPWGSRRPLSLVRDALEPSGGEPIISSGSNVATTRSRASTAPWGSCRVVVRFAMPFDAPREPERADSVRCLREILYLLRSIHDRLVTLERTERVKDALWDKDDVALFLKRSASSVSQMAEEGALPSFKIGGHRRFDPSAVREWVRRGADAEQARVQRSRPSQSE